MKHIFIALVMLIAAPYLSIAQNTRGGIGIKLETNDYLYDYPFVTEVTEGSAAAIAGVKADDIILSINSISTENMSAAEAEQLLNRGTGPEIKLKVSRGGAQVMLTVKQQEIKNIKSDEGINALEFSLKSIDFCKGFNEIVLASPNKFDKIKGSLQKDDDLFATEYYTVKVKMDGFKDAKIEKTLASYYAVYYEGTNETEANEKYLELVKLVQSCKACCTFKISEEITEDYARRTILKPEKTEAFFPEELKKTTVRVNRSTNMLSSKITVSLVVLPPQ